MCVNAAAVTCMNAANTVALAANINNLHRQHMNLQRQIMQTNMQIQQRQRMQSEKYALERERELLEKQRQQMSNENNQQPNDEKKIILTEKQKQDEAQRIKEQKYQRLLDYILLAESCQSLICPLDLFDPETWEFKKEECPFCKSCFEITPFDWSDGLHRRVGHMGCFTYGEDLFRNDNPPIKKIIKKLKFEERNIDIMDEDYFKNSIFGLMGVYNGI